ncbi:ankyrin repeat domain-containing protein [Listeria costaricensis]|uniref:ankyrin repeat domain-containing protein n=1 Tax=Listeria costaricensis TaxID=2026604 RepID=UPI000C076A4C|nr:ankyrin repeat domain-containing protein [Listeria costaricensis]
MVRKRKTLPKDFREMLAEGDMNKLKAVFDKCELDATNGYNKEVALTFFQIPAELTRWLVENGADINKPDYYQRTPLHHHAGYRYGDLALLIELGASIEAKDRYKNTPLHMAAESSAQMVQQLLDAGANPLAKNEMNETPLERALARANNLDIPQLVPISALLLKAGTPITEKMKASVERIGQNFEFHRAGFNTELLPETDAALTRLYDLFQVPPVPRRNIHDGHSPIEVAPGKWNEQYQALWSLLIPSSGPAQTVQGEAIRITGRVSDELQRNGGANWNADYRKMLTALPHYFQMGEPLEKSLLKEAQQITKAGSQIPDESLTRLCELAVIWVLANPAPMQLGKVEYQR